MLAIRINTPPFGVSLVGSPIKDTSNYYEGHIFRRIRDEKQYLILKDIPNPEHCHRGHIWNYKKKTSVNLPNERGLSAIMVKGI